MLAAGKALGLSTSTTARRLDALEAAIGCQLVFRSRSGTELKPQALQMTPRRFPQVDLELVGESRLADVAARGADIAVRLTRSTSNVLVEKHLSSLRFALFASSDYVRRFLPTRQLGKDACVHTFVGLDERWKGLPHEQWVRELGATRFAFRSSSMEAIAEAVRQGAGLAAFLEKDPRTEDLIRVETKITGPTQPFYLVYHRDLRKQPHVRAAIIAIETYMRANR
ncbi:LysR substrate binding domain protein [Necator americanus]|uniref:LysR substrate binding domain protein n=1 Tax=Necator americanus TaxID=51031 RepID=W2TX17_NECAM|nr:LysR substrate binding domain protein [Necator americanus]ETN86625.1 LysR substrate binding domain protein [Necator americanus]